MAEERLVAVGRDSQIFDAGPGLVVKRARAERPLAYEANAMDLARAFGVPVPKVHEVRANDCEIVMDRVEGPTLLQWIEQGPWRLERAARILGELADVVHAVPAPSWMRDVGDGGDRVVHLDLHPLNVIMSADGPVLIDWANTGRGAPATDDALTWVLLATGQPDDAGFALRATATLFRGVFVRRYLAHRDRVATRAALPHAAELRLCVPNLRPAEAHSIHRLLAKVGARPTP